MHPGLSGLSTVSNSGNLWKKQLTHSSKKASKNPNHWLVWALNVTAANSCASDIGWTWWRQDLCKQSWSICNLIPHKMFQLRGRRGFYYFSQLPTLHQPMSSLPTSSRSSLWTHTHPWCLLVHCYLEQQQSATNTTCSSSGFLASHGKISPWSCQLAVLLLRKSLPALQPFVFGQLSPWPDGLNTSPPLTMKA